MTDAKTATHRLLLSKRSDVVNVIRELNASSDVPLDAVKTLAEAWIVLHDVLEFEIRRIDELELRGQA